MPGNRDRAGADMSFARDRSIEKSFTAIYGNVSANDGIIPQSHVSGEGNDITINSRRDIYGLGKTTQGTADIAVHSDLLRAGEDVAVDIPVDRNDPCGCQNVADNAAVEIDGAAGEKQIFLKITGDVDVVAFLVLVGRDRGAGGQQKNQRQTDPAKAGRHRSCHHR